VTTELGGPWSESLYQTLSILCNSFRLRTAVFPVRSASVDLCDCCKMLMQTTVCCKGENTTDASLLSAALPKYQLRAPVTHYLPTSCILIRCYHSEITVLSVALGAFLRKKLLIA